MRDPLAFMDVDNVPASSPEEQIALLGINPTMENQKLISDLKQSIQQGLASTEPGNPSPTMVDHLNDAMPQGLTPLLVSPSGKCGYFRRQSDGALLQKLNGQMTVL
jgi:hypothetical protein